MAGADAGQESRPQVLIVQIPQLKERDVDINLLLDTYLADELDSLGQVDPVTWSLTDPVFRGWLDAGKIKGGMEPTETNARELARSLGIPYVMVIAAIKNEMMAKPTARLYRTGGNRPIWAFADIKPGGSYSPTVTVDGKVDPKRTKDLLETISNSNAGSKGFTVLVNGMPDWDSTARTIARTWTQILATSAFKNFPEHRRVNVEPGHRGANKTDPAQLPISAGGDPSAQVDQYLQQKRPDLAILVLRDAIDQNPFDAGSRARLAWLLFDQGFPAAAAEEARRAAKLSPKDIELWLLAARGWMIAGNPEEAQKDVNEALSRGGKDVSTRSLLGDVYLLQGKYESACEEYTLSIQAGPKPEAIAGRAIALAMMGRPVQSQADLDFLKGIPASKLGRAYDMAIQLVEFTDEHLAENLRTLPPAIRLAPKSPEVVIRAQLAERLARALSGLIAAIPCPPEHQKSHQGRDLAQKLLSQSAQEILDFARTGDGEIGQEAVITLSEGLKRLPIVREYYRIERGQS